MLQKQSAYTRRTNARHYDGVRLPRYGNLDFTFQKRFRLTEKLDFEFPVETYNLINSLMRANLSTSRTSSTFGMVVNKNSVHRGREFQYSGRFYW